MSKRKVTDKSVSKSTKKLPWVDMEVTRVYLNPERAVLSCCDSISRRGPIVTGQCDITCGGAILAMSSS